METTTSGWKRASTDWFHDAGWGVFCHFCFHSPTEMSAGDWNRLVDGFDVDGLASRNFAQRTMPEADYGPMRRFIDGEQYHMLNFIGQEWGKGPARLTPELVAAYTQFVAANDAVITWDVPIGKGGRIPEAFMAHLRAIGAAMGRRSMADA